jgi:hypothetical protein
MQDGSWGLTFMIFAIMAFKLFIATMRLETHNFVMSLVWLFQYLKSLNYFLQLVANPSNAKSIISIFIGCVTSAPDGSCPRGYSRKKFEYRLRRIAFLVIFFHYALHNTITIFFLFFLYFIGCATSAPDESSPRGYKGMLAASYRLKINYLHCTLLYFPLDLFYLFSFLGSVSPSFFY